MNTANKLTLIRIALVPVLLVLLYRMDGSFNLSLFSALLFLLISLTDSLDGYVARKYNQITDFGKFLDPLADKILVLSVMMVMVELHYLSSLAVIIVIIREFLVTSLRLMASKDAVVIAASGMGKVKTVIQMVVLTVLMFTPALNQIAPVWLLPVLVWIMVLITVISGLDYLFKNIHLINHTK